MRIAEVKSFGIGAREVSSLYPDPSLGLRKLAEHNKRRRRASVTLACRFVAVGAVFGVTRLPRGHDLGSNLLRGHIGRRETG
jgi:hypothetical protein